MPSCVVLLEHVHSYLHRFLLGDHVELTMCRVLCVLGRVEVDDDARSYDDGIHVDPYGDECGEVF